MNNAMSRQRRTTTMMITALLIAASLLMSSHLGPVAALQDDDELLTGEDLGLPEIVIAATDEGWDAPAELSAGRYLVTVSYEGEREFGTTAFALLPGDWTVDDFNRKLAETAGRVEPVATPETEFPGGGPDLSWLYDMTLAGGVSPTPGTTEQGIVDLAAGNWVIWADSYDPAAIPLTVTGSPPSIQSIPQATMSITGVSENDEFRFDIEGEFSTERQIIEITNQSSQPMYIEFVKITDLVTPEQLEAFMTAPADAEPDPALGLPEGFDYGVTPFYSAIQSDGSRQWIITSFEPGAYGMVCWMPDPEHDGASHASLGMIETFEVS